MFELDSGIGEGQQNRTSLKVIHPNLQTQRSQFRNSKKRVGLTYLPLKVNWSKSIPRALGNLPMKQQINGPMNQWIPEPQIYRFPLVSPSVFNSHKKYRPILLAALLMILLCGTAPAERLPVRVYTTADGLADNIINKIVRDSRGFLWFCTAGGLSRFDGYDFTNYGTDQGLPQSGINDLLETRSGDYWVATSGGLVHFNPKGLPATQFTGPNDPAPMFEVVLPEETDRHARFVTSLFESRDGSVWCGTHKGLFRLNTSDRRFRLQPVDIGMPLFFFKQKTAYEMVEDRQSSLWIATPR